MQKTGQQLKGVTTSRRNVLYGAGIAGMLMGLGPSMGSAFAADSGLPIVPATIKRSLFKGVPYELITLQAANSSGHVGRTPGTSTGKLDRTPPITHDLIDGPSVYKKFPKDIYFAANTTNNGIFRGPQIQDGKIFQGFTGMGDPFLNNIPRGMYALGAKKDGSVKVYYYEKDSAESMLEEGVINSWTFSVALTIDGAVQRPDDNPKWGKHKHLNFISARTILGADKNNRMMVLTSEGTSSKSGISLNDTAVLAKEAGFHNSVVLDGGGSVQLLHKGEFIHKSSDASGSRRLPDWGYFDSLDLYEEETALPSGTVYRGTMKDGNTYEHLIVQSKGKPGVLTKVYGGRPDGISGKAEPNLTVTNMSPLDHYRNTPYPFMFNDAASNSAGRVSGIQIQNSILIKDYDSGTSTGVRGNFAIGFDRSGNAKIYNKFAGATSKDLLADKVHTSFGFGPLLVQDGQDMVDISNPYYSVFDFVSSRQIFGVDRNGNLMLLTVNGASNKFGIGLKDSAKFALEKGFYQAVMLDSGGSAQTVLNGEFLHPSTDSLGYRTISTMGAINANITETKDYINTSFDKSLNLNDFEEYYHNNGGEAKFGKPTSQIWVSKDGGRVQNFSGPYAFYSNNKDGVHAVFTSGAIGQYYRSKNWELGKLGYPVNDETLDGFGGVYQDFRNSSGGFTSLVWSEKTGAREVNKNGAIYERWMAKGGQQKVGYPSSNEYPLGEGVGQDFLLGNHKRVMVWGPYGTGTVEMNKNGAIFHKWTSLGYGNIGLPETDEVPEQNGGASVTFRKRDGSKTKILWSQQTGATAQNPNGALYREWIARGGITKIGYPTHDERRESDGYIHLRFTSGLHLRWSATTGVRSV